MKGKIVGTGLALLISTTTGCGTQAEVKAPPGVRELPSVRAGNIGGIEVDGCTASIGTDHFFSFGSARLLDQDRLRPLLTGLGSCPRRIKIVGRTDGIGPAEYNRDLSLQRAKAVEHWLLVNDVEPDAIAEVGGVGEIGAPDGVAAPDRRRVDITLTD